MPLKLMQYRNIHPAMHLVTGALQLDVMSRASAQRAAGYPQSMSKLLKFHQHQTLSQTYSLARAKRRRLAIGALT